MEEAKKTMLAKMLEIRSSEKPKSSSENDWERERNIKAFYDQQDEMFLFLSEPNSGRKQLVLIEEEHGKDIGARVWDVALIISKYIELNPDIVRNKRCLEIGAGTGIVGILSAVLGATSIVLTDLPRVLPILQKQVEVNRNNFLELTGGDISETVFVQELTWGKNVGDYQQLFGDNLDLILVSDLAAPTKEVPNLIESLRALLQLNKHSRILLALNIIREFTPPFLEQSANIFEFAEIEQTKWHPKYTSPRCRMFWISLKPTI